MKILVTGGGGQVASEIVPLALAAQHEVLAPSHQQLDITQFMQLDKIFREFEPDVVINTAAYTKVDHAEKEPDLAYAVNAVGTRYLAVLAAEQDCRLLHISTDYVFDGKQTFPYTEEDEPSPINVYGKTKLEGEYAIQDDCAKYLILRVSSVFGSHGNNFIKTIAQLARTRKELQVVKDQISCPTPAKAIASVLLQLAEQDEVASGIYHYCGKPSISWYELAEKIVALLIRKEELMVKNIVPVVSEDYPTAAKRPLYSVLNCNKIKQFFAISQPHWENELLLNLPSPARSGGEGGARSAEGEGA